MFDMEQRTMQRAPRQSKTQPLGDWFSRFTATTAGVFCGGAILLVALYFLITAQVEKAIKNFNKDFEARNSTTIKKP